MPVTARQLAARLTSMHDETSTTLRKAFASLTPMQRVAVLSYVDSKMIDNAHNPLRFIVFVAASAGLMAAERDALLQQFEDPHVEGNGTTDPDRNVD